MVVGARRYWGNISTKRGESKENPDRNFYNAIGTAYGRGCPAWALIQHVGVDDAGQSVKRKPVNNKLLLLGEGDNITIDGLRLQNSIGRGISILETSENCSIKNCRIDWCLYGAIVAEPQQKGFTIREQPHHAWHL